MLGYLQYLIFYLYGEFGVNTKHLNSIFTTTFLFRENNDSYNERMVNKMNKMNNFNSVETFSNEQLFISNKKCIESIANILNSDLSEWDLVKVPIKREFIDELMEVIKYEWRYRLYLSKVYEMLGYDSLTQNRYSGYYWEKDKDGNDMGFHSP